MTSRKKLILNFVGFELGWFACVLGGAHGLVWLGPLIVILFATWHVRRAVYPKSELCLLLIGTLVGSLFDQLLLTSGWIAYPPSSLPSWLLPPWMMALWLIFCTTLNVSMRWLRIYPRIAMAFGAIGGPLAYWGGVKLGAMSWLQPSYVALALAFGWGVAMPLLSKLSTVYDGYVKA